MDPEDLIQQYHPADLQEAQFKEKFLELLKEDSAFLRSNLHRHFTASGFVVADDRSRILLMLHKKLNLWVQPGGHADGDRDLRAVALKEFHEETGIDSKPDCSESLFHIDLHRIPEAKGIPAHDHYDCRFLMIVPADVSILRNEESMDLAWFTIDELKKIKTDSSVVKMAMRASQMGYLES